VSIGYAINNSL